MESQRIRIFLLLYIVGAVVDDVLTFYFTGVAQLWTEINPFNKIVEYNPYLFLLVQVAKELIGILLVLLVVKIVYRITHKLHRPTTVARHLSTLILYTAVTARWLPVIYILIQIPMYKGFNILY